MALLFDRVKVATATTGTGNITFGSAIAGFQTFAQAGAIDDDQVRYIIEDGTAWEIGTGTLSGGATILARNSILASSNGGTPLNLSGSAVVFCDVAAVDILDRLLESGGTISGNLNVTGTISQGGSALSTLFASAAYGNEGHIAYGWGDHAGQYLPIGGGVLTGPLVVSPNTSASALSQFTVISPTSAPALFFAGSFQSLSTTNGNAVALAFGVDSNALVDAKGAIIYERDNTWGRGKFHVALDPDTGNGEVTLADAVATFERNGDFWVKGSITLNGTVDGRDIAADGSKLDGIEAGATADQTPAEILAALLTVDGPGSLLNADLLDGKHHTEFATSAQGSNADTAYSWGDHAGLYLPIGGGTLTGSLTVNGNISTTGRVNLGQQEPVVVDWVAGQKNPVFVMKGWENYGLFWKEGSPDTFQISTTGETTAFALEIDRDNGLTRKGHLVWDAGNDGTGSGLDADLLDGLHASAFATAAQGALADTALQPAAIGTTIQGYSAVLAGTTASFTTAQETKLGHISVTQAVDLDAIEARVNELDASVILKGVWDASVGTFPGGGTAQAGESWIVSVGGTVGGVVFTANDRIVAITDNASTATYASNWHKMDYTDAVLSVAGKTGAVTLAKADITDFSDGDYATAAQGALAATAVQPAAIANSGNWDTAYSWGNHASAGYAAASHTHAISEVTGLQTALDGKATAAQGALADTAVQPAAIANASNWDTAYSWGNHASAGYVLPTQYPTFSNNGIKVQGTGPGVEFYETDTTAAAWLGLAASSFYFNVAASGDLYFQGSGNSNIGSFQVKYGGSFRDIWHAGNLVPGTAANNIVQLDGNAKLPAVDGSNLTNLPATGITTGKAIAMAMIFGG